MRKIDKARCLSRNYKNWEDKLGDPHPNYTSSNHVYYKDIVMSLFHCQRGLCAYTERRLCPPEFYQEALWCNNEEGDRHYHPERPEHFGQLDHFNPELKQSRGWSWDNFFMIDSDINRKSKSTRVPDPILKPDQPNYDPDRLFVLESNFHFAAHPDLDQTEKERVSASIDILGLNFKALVDARRKSVAAWRMAQNLGMEEDEEYPTARRMTVARDTLLQELRDLYPGETKS